jgi:hypothetical protein
VVPWGISTSLSGFVFISQSQHGLRLNHNGLRLVVLRVLPRARVLESAPIVFIPAEWCHNSNEAERD